MDYVAVIAVIATQVILWSVDLIQIKICTHMARLRNSGLLLEFFVPVFISFWRQCKTSGVNCS